MFDHCNPGVYEEYTATNKHFYFKCLTIVIQEHMKCTLQRTNILLQRFNHCNPGIYEEQKVCEEYNTTNNQLFFKDLTIVI